MPPEFPLLGLTISLVVALILGIILLALLIFS